MFTNDHSAGPIQQWLIFLCDNCSFVIQQMTIDCSILEVNAIQSVYLNAMIYYCAFHVLQAWNCNLKSKVRLDASYIAEEQQQLHNNMMQTLKVIMCENSINLMYAAIEEFKDIFYDQYEFLDYFQEYWEPEHIIRRWAYAYIDPS
ncbi:hypothetical protein BDA99DRAFT_564922 [Phascolomyces articulosus]|uniref:MULE transposase domain-containing protein n=1 Tax=Phascolomyces articulosus TaxID=60185 RepID=A0AAD5JNV0_9FUNG|nr:hypothetical protein BDA99DRAFT_564922 [Phascolomyces articulosus]